MRAKNSKQHLPVAPGTFLKALAGRTASSGGARFSDAPSALQGERRQTSLLPYLLLPLWLAVFLSNAFAATQTRTSSFTYDNVTGLLLTETVEPDSPAFTVTTAYTYDDFGNVLTTTVSGTDITSRTSSATYEANGRFALTQTNALGHTQSTVTDDKFSVVTSQTGPNSITTDWVYDDFGRVVLESRVDGTKTEYDYEYCSGVAGGTASCPSYAVYLVTQTPKDSGDVQNGPQVKTFYDNHGREIGVETQGFAGEAIHQTTRYNSAGQVWLELLPQFSGQASKWTSYEYDALGRVIAINLPDSSRATFDFEGLTTRVTNDKNQTETTVKNARGEVVSVTDANGKAVSFTYDPFGNRTSITDAAGNVATMTYDKAGRKVASIDPDLGSWTYSYNVLGELVSQTDAKGQTTTMTYDKLGRSLTRAAGGVTSTWTYDTATKGVGKLHTASTTNGYLRTLSYDALGRPATTTIRSATGEPSHTTTTSYDADSRIDRIAYPSGFEVQYAYTSLGYPSQLSEFGGATLWTANEMDQELRLTRSTAGNGVVTSRTFDRDRGFLTDIEAGASNAVADFSYVFDTLGNLTQRADANLSLTENFTYDVLNRLTSYAIVGGAAKTMTYDDLGNITSKSDVGAYVYPGAGNPRPHAVSSAGGQPYAYDANGNMIAGAGRTLTWTAFNKVASIAQGATSLSWEYGPERQRVKQTAPAGTTYYYNDEASGVFFEKLVGATVTQWSDYLFVGGEMIGVHFSRSDATEFTRWYVSDHLGSIAVLTDETGAVAERLSYDAWGKRRFPNGTDDPTGSISSTTTRGFTGHEMIDDVDLVNMNGRVYEPTIGRFLSPDPFIQDVTNTQNLNRYTYVNNNPLSYTDPSGYFFKKLFGFFAKALKKFWKPLLAIAVAIVLQQYYLPGLLESLSVPQAVAAPISAGISGGVSNVILTGRPKSFLAGFGQSVLTYGVGHKIAGPAATKARSFGSLGKVGKAVAHGVVGGAFAEIRGGSFKSGFLAAGFSSAAGSIYETNNVWKGAAFHAVVGGTGSVLGGGKFKDGAVTGAFTYLYNDAMGRIRNAIATVRARIRDEWVDELRITYQDGYEYRTSVRITDIQTWYDTSQGDVSNTENYTYDWSDPIWVMDDFINNQLDTFAPLGGYRVDVQSPLEGAAETAGEVIEGLLDAASNYWEDPFPRDKKRRR